MPVNEYGQIIGESMEGYMKAKRGWDEGCKGIVKKACLPGSIFLFMEDYSRGLRGRVGNAVGV